MQGTIFFGDVGASKLTFCVGFRAPEELHEWLKEQGREDGRSAHEVARDLIVLAWRARKGQRKNQRRVGASRRTTERTDA